MVDLPVGCFEHEAEAVGCLVSSGRPGVVSKTFGVSIPRSSNTCIWNKVMVSLCTGRPKWAVSCSDHSGAVIVWVKDSVRIGDGTKVGRGADEEAA